MYTDRCSCCLCTGFKNLYESEELFDVALSVDGREFQGHRALLAASSDYFRAMFTTNLAEKDLKVTSAFYFRRLLPLSTRRQRRKTSSFG